MTQVDRGQTELQQGVREEGVEQGVREEGVIEYEGQILEQMRFVEDTINKFAIQNYAASGGVLLAYFASSNKIPLLIVAIIVALLNLNFGLAIIIQIERLKKLFVMHCIVRNHWLDHHRTLSGELMNNPVGQEVIRMNTLPGVVFYVLLIAQFIPIFGVFILGIF